MSLLFLLLLLRMLLLLLMLPISEFLLEAEQTMLNSLHAMLTLMA